MARWDGVVATGQGHSRAVDTGSRSSQDSPSKEEGRRLEKSPVPAPTSGGGILTPFAPNGDNGTVGAPEVAPAPRPQSLLLKLLLRDPLPTDQVDPATQDQVTPPQTRVLPKWKVGDHVQAKWMGQGRMYPGVIKRVNEPGAANKWVHVVCTKFVQMHKIYAFAQILCTAINSVQHGMCVSDDGWVAGTQKWQGTHTLSYLMMVIKTRRCWRHILHHHCQ